MEEKSLDCGGAFFACRSFCLHSHLVGIDEHALQARVELAPLSSSSLRKNGDVYRNAPA